MSTTFSVTFSHLALLGGWGGERDRGGGQQTGRHASIRAFFTNPINAAVSASKEIKVEHLKYL
jgi:hypothetical protein